jgi:beta-mannosidase
VTSDTLSTTSSVRTTALTSEAGVAWTVRSNTELSPEWAAIGDAEHPAQVPGEVHTALLSEGLIPDPFDGDNETALAWIGRTDWVYQAEFQWQPGTEQRHDLVADGLDTVATISLNGTEVARTANQHRSYRFDVASLLVPGSNTVTIAFEAPINAAERLAAKLGDRPRAYGDPFNAIRKMASGYGWDWGPNLAGVGILGGIAIESWSTVRLATVRPLATVDGSDGALDVHVDLEWTDSAASPARVAIQVGEVSAEVAVPSGQTSAVVSARVPDANLWWPTGYGEPNLYPLSVRLTADDQGMGHWDGRIGFRTVTMSIEPDAAGSEFVISVNDKPIYVKGANWIPDDALMSRLTLQTYRTSINEAVDAGMNLLRVWGGGIYEREEFYNLCDELGLLVWQDFLFACAAYSEDEPLYSEVEAEAREAITRLSSHPSLAIWNGNNENIWGFVEWGWRAPLAGRSWGDGYYTDLLPRLVAELDPRTPYSAGSPFSYAPYHHPNDPRHGSMHIWDVWNQVDYSHYRDYPARYVSEFGFQGPAAWSTLFSVVHDEPLDPYGPQMLVHQKAADGNGKLERGLGNHLPKWSTEPVANMDDWHWITSLNQARAVAYGINHFRSLFPLNRGTVVWQLNDNWPVISWAAVDWNGIRKPLWHALKAVYQPRLLTLQPRPDDEGNQLPTLVAHNDSDQPWQGRLTVTRRSTGVGSDVLAEQHLELDVDPRGATTIALDADIVGAADPATEFIVVSTPGAAPAFWYFVEDTELSLVSPAEGFEARAERTDSGYDVTVTAKALVKDVSLFPDRLDAASRVDSGLITLIAGEQHTFTVTSGELDSAALTSVPVLRSVNDLVAR